MLAGLYEAPSYIEHLCRMLPSSQCGAQDPRVNMDITSNERQLLANLLQASGRDPASFHVSVQPDGLVRVSGPRGTAIQAGWR